MNRYSVVLSLASLFFAGIGVAKGDQGALIDALVRKKVLTQKEANELKADLIEDGKKEEKAREESKLRLSDSIKELRIGGSLKMRYQSDDYSPRVHPEGRRLATERSRFRFRLRLNADFLLYDQWLGGVQLVSSNFADTGYQTFSGGFRNYDIYISRAFIGWNATDWSTYVFGKQANPFYTSDLVWDSDINPAGMVEQFRLGDWWFGPEAKERPWDVTFVAGQLFFADNTEWQTPNAYLFAQQVVFEYTFSNKVKGTFAPAYLTFHPARASGALNTAAFSPETDRPLWINEASALSIIQAPGDVRWKWYGVPVRAEWDFAFNTDGAKRMRDVYGIDSHTLEDDLAFLVGLRLGENKKKGDLSFYANYRRVGMAAVDPNLNDSTFALSRLNVHGVKTGLAYSFTDAVVGSVTYNGGWKMREGVRGGQATGGAELGNINEVHVLQVDMDLKF